MSEPLNPPAKNPPSEKKPLVKSLRALLHPLQTPKGLTIPTTGSIEIPTDSWIESQVEAGLVEVI